MYFGMLVINIFNWNFFSIYFFLKIYFGAFQALEVRGKKIKLARFPYLVFGG
jgi:hypothetical protein